MRGLLVLLISCLVLSNAVSATGICCLAMEKAQNGLVENMPCHDTSDIDNNQDIEQHKSCQCQGCFQFSNLVDADKRTFFPVVLVQHHYNNLFTPPDPDRIYYPPKRIS